MVEGLLHVLGRSGPACFGAELSVAGVELSAGGELTVELDWRGEALRLILGTGGV